MLNIKRLTARAFACAAWAAIAACAAQADVLATLRFDNVTANNPTDVITGKNQLRVDVGNDIGAALASSNQVRFTFKNMGTLASSITDVYFDDGSLLSLAYFEEDTGVSFSAGASPPNLPGGENAIPPFVASFAADSDPPVSHNGVNPGEQLRIIFNLQPGRTIPDVVEDLTSGALRVGIHVQGFASGGSESFVNIPVPEPASILPGLLAAVLWRRRAA